MNKIKQPYATRFLLLLLIMAVSSAYSQNAVSENDSAFKQIYQTQRFLDLFKSNKNIIDEINKDSRNVSPNLQWYKFFDEIRLRKVIFKNESTFEIIRIVVNNDEKMGIAELNTFLARSNIKCISKMSVYNGLGLPSTMTIRAVDFVAVSAIMEIELLNEESKLLLVKFILGPQ